MIIYSQKRIYFASTYSDPKHDTFLFNIILLMLMRWLETDMSELRQRFLMLLIISDGTPSHFKQGHTLNLLATKLIKFSIVQNGLSDAPDTGKDFGTE